MPQSISVDSLGVNTALPNTLYAHNGTRLLDDGTLLLDGHLEVFQQFNTSEVYVPEPGEDDGHCFKSLKFIEKNLIDVSNKETLGEGVSDAKGRLLIKQNEKVEEAQKDILLRQGITIVYINRHPNKEENAATNRLATALKEVGKKDVKTKVGEKFRFTRVKTERLLKGTRKLEEKDVQDFEAKEASREITMDAKVRAIVEPARLEDDADESDSERIRAARKKLLTSISQVFNELEGRNRVDGKDIGDILRQIVSEIVSDRYHRMHLSEDVEEDNYLSSHALTTTVLSVNIAGRLGYSFDEILEMSYGALLHDIGMLRVKPEVRSKAEKLDHDERHMIDKHPVRGLEMCQYLRKIPATTPIIIMQENERLDGSGFPRGKSLKSLHPYSRIVSVAACYDAMTRKRPYRDAILPYNVMTELLFNVKSKKLDADCVRSLLESLGLFPVASRVELSDGRKGTVLDAAGSAYTRPVIAVDTDKLNKATQKVDVVDLQHAKNKNTTIIRAVPV